MNQHALRDDDLPTHQAVGDSIGLSQRAATGHVKAAAAAAVVPIPGNVPRALLDAAPRARAEDHPRRLCL
jgi:hypothetical protein